MDSYFADPENYVFDPALMEEVESVCHREYATGFFFGHGSGNYISRALGRQDNESASQMASIGFFSAMIIGLLIMTFGLIFLDPLAIALGSTETILPYAKDYMRIILIGAPYMMAQLVLNNQMRFQGNAVFSMLGLVSGAVLNVVLDPLFIFETINLGFVQFSGLGWGIRGAAIATILAQCISLVWQVRVMSDKRELIHFKRGIYRLNSYIVKEVLTIGLSPCLMNLASCFVVIFINRGLAEYGGDYAVGAYGIVHKMTFIFVMIVMGFTQGMQPIAGYNYGAKAYDRVNKVLKITIALATGVTTLAFVIGEFCPEVVARIFTSDEQMVEMAAVGMRYNCLLFPIVGFQMVTGNFFQSIAQPGKSIFLSLSRQLLFLVPFIIIFPHFWGINGVWASLPASDLVSSVISACLLGNYFRKHKM